MVKTYQIIAMSLGLALLINTPARTAQKLKGDTECTSKADCENKPQGSACLGATGGSPPFSYIFELCTNIPHISSCSCGCLDDSECQGRKNMTGSGSRCIPSTFMGLPHCGCEDSSDCGPGLACSTWPGSSYKTCHPRSILKQQQQPKP